MDSTYTSTYESTTVDPAAAAAMSGVMLVFMLIGLVAAVISIVSMWKLFTKAGKPGWAAIIPIYNNIVMLEIAGRPAWWVVLMMFVPFFGLWVAIVSQIDFVRSYQRSGLWVLGIAVAPFIALPMLAFSEKTKYAGPIAAGRTDFAPAPVPGDAHAQPTPPAAPSQM